MANIVYEQPVNELIRVFLRLEHLFNKVDFYYERGASNYCAELTQVTIDILNFLDRPDLKSKITQELHRYIGIFNRLTNSPDISHDTLQNKLADLEKLLAYFSNFSGKVGQHLRDTEFLSTLRSRLNTPAGDCCFNTPAYYYWLRQDKDACLKEIESWLSHFDQIRKVTTLILEMIRHSAEAEEKTANGGLHFESLGAQVPTQLIRVSFDDALNVYPEISAGKHRLNIIFHVLSVESRAYQSNENIPFELTICNI